MWSELGEAQLASWGISHPQADEAGLFEVPDASMPLPGCPARPGIIIPYYQPDGAILQIKGQPFGRVRWLNVQHASGFHGKVKASRYGQPPDTNVQVYFPPMVDWGRILNDPTIPLMITEGEAKALTATWMGFTCIALGGVYSFANQGELVKVLAEAAWKDRPVVIVYDSDAATNPAVLAAEARLVEELGTRRQARVKIVRLPDDGTKKVGLDDFLNSAGPDELERLIDEAQNLGALDAKIIGLNRSVAWIEHEGQVYDMEQQKWIQKANFTNGSRFSTLTHITQSKKRGDTQTINVAEKWLKHPHAQRYSDVLFRAGEAAVVPAPNGQMALNLWTGWNEELGDITPFLKLTEFLTSHEPRQEVRELPLRLLAYKAQHPMQKIPIAITLTGPTGTGKSLWTKIVRGAFSPYSAVVAPGQLGSDFHPWLEKSVIGTIDELDVPTFQKNSEMLKALISDERRQLNDKFRLMRDIDSPTMYLITSNYTGVGGGFSHDDRRILAFHTPAPDTNGVEKLAGAWFDAGGQKKLMHWLLNRDLGTWAPPQRPPVTATKSLAYREGQTPIQQLADDMRTSTFNTIHMWVGLAGEWARAQEIGSDPKLASQARAVLAGIQQIQIRPWYTAEELTLIFPTVLAQVYSNRSRENWTPGGLSRTLRDAGIPFLVNRDSPDGFMWQGKMRQYLVISQFDDWENAITQTDFDRAMRNWPTFGQIERKGRQ